MTYAEALKLVARDDQRIALLDRALGGFLLAAAPFTAFGSLALIDPKTELISQIRQMTDTVPGRIKAKSGKPHLELLEAAHTTLGLSAFFDAFEAVADDLYRELELTPAERKLIVDRGAEGPLTRELRRGTFPMPTPVRGYEENLVLITQNLTALADALVRFLAGIEAWERRRPGDPAAFIQPLVARATEIYQQNFRRFAVDIPEFGYWMQTNFVSAAVAGMTDSLDALEARLASVGATGTVNAVERKLARRTHDVLADSIWPTEIAGLAFPSVEDGFISPDFRIAPSPLPRDAELASEEWWQEEASLRGDLAGFLTQYLTSPDSAKRPLVVLGHPGAGKTLLSKVVAARIPAESFTTVLVKLREVAGSAAPHVQIEEAIERTVRETVDWGVFCRESARTKVVIFDGLDELIQATRTPQTNYIETIADFQRQEWRDDNAVITIITSRHLVMDRVGVPPDALVIKLEDFSDAQVHRWVGNWNRTNEVSPGFHPLTADAVLDREKLLRQPLLIFLLAIYAAGDGGRLDDPALSGAGLYRALIDSFVTRQVRDKARKPLSRDEQSDGEYALRRDLSIAAFAMSNRGGQAVTEDELSDDLELLAPARGERRTGRGDTLSRVKATVAAFFFIHKAEGRQHRVEERLESYEFLHATFGEYLVAEYTARQVQTLTGDFTRLSAGRRIDSLDDDLLFALLSQRALAIRRPVLDFIAELLTDADKEVLAYLFNRARKSQTRGDLARYAPAENDVVGSLATYTANLATLMALIHPGGVRIGDFTTQDYWTSTVRLWRAGLDADGQEEVFNYLDADDGVLRPAGYIFLSLEEATARLIGDYRAELHAVTGASLWQNSPSSRAQADFYAELAALSASRWPVPAMETMTVADLDSYHRILHWDQDAHPIDAESASFLLNLLIEDGPYLPPELTTDLVVLSLPALGGEQPRYFSLQALAHRCPYLLDSPAFAEALANASTTEGLTGSVLLRRTARLHDHPFLRELAARRSASDWGEDQIGSAYSTPGLVKELADDDVADQIVIALIQTLSDYPHVTWDHVDPHDLIRLLVNRPDLDRAEIAKPIASYLAHRRAMGTPEAELAELLPYAGN